MLLSFNVTATLFDIIVKAIIVLNYFVIEKYHYDDGDNEMILIH